MSLISYHNKTDLKKSVLAQMSAHRKADELVKRVYWSGGKGCTVGCLLKSSNHEEYETRLGIPQMLARLEDAIFEGLPHEEAQKWPEKFLGSIKVGVDLSLVGWKFQLWIQADNLKRAKKEKMPSDVIEAIKLCIDVLKPLAVGGGVDVSTAESVAWSAWSAWSVAWSPESVAWSARWAAESAARSAESVAVAARWARSAELAELAASAAASAASAESAAWVTAEAEAWSKMAKKLISLISEVE